MSISSVKGLINPSKEEVVGFFRALPLNGGNMSKGLDALLKGSEESLFRVLKSGDEKAVDEWIKQSVKKLDSVEDINFVTGNAFKNALLDVSRMNAMKTDFFKAYYKGEAIDLSGLATKYKQSGTSLISDLDQNFLKKRDEQISSFASLIASRHPGTNASQYKDEATKFWAENVGSKMADEAAGHSAPTKTVSATSPAPTTVTATAGTGKPKLTLVRNDGIAAQSDNTIAASHSDAPHPSAENGSTSSHDAGGNKNGGGGKGGEPPRGGGSGGGDEPPRNGGLSFDFDSSGPKKPAGGTQLPSFTLKESYITHSHGAEQTGLTKKISWAIGDGLPFGDYNPAKAKTEMESGKFADFVAPENAPHLTNTLFMLSPKGARSAVDRFFSWLSDPKKMLPYWHKSLPNVFSDTQYIRPIIKEADARMKASGLSEAVYEMQVKMRNLTESMANGSEMTAAQYKSEMQKIYKSYASDAKFQESSKKFVNALDKIIRELENKENSITRAVLDEKGNPVPTKYNAFDGRAGANGLSGLTVEQARGMKEYYKDIRKTALDIANPDSGFADKYMNKIPDDFKSTMDRNKLAENMRTTFIGYHLDDGVVGGGRLSRIGSEVEQRNTGFNLFKNNADSLKAQREWDLAKHNGTLSKKDELAGRPELIADDARYDELTRLERLMKHNLAFSVDRTVAVQTKSNENNPEAIFFTLLHEGAEKGNWDVVTGGDFAQSLISIRKQGYEEQVAELVDILFGLIGPDTSRKTMPRGQVDIFLNTAINEAKSAGDELGVLTYTNIKDKLHKVEQMPLEQGNRAATAAFMKYYVPYYTARAFASNGHQTIPFMGKGLLEKAVGIFGGQEAKEKFIHATQLNMPASAPQKYATIAFTQNNLQNRIIGYFLGTGTVPAEKKIADVTSPAHYVKDDVNWKKLLPWHFWGNSEFTPVEGTGLKAKIQNTFGRISSAFDNSPAWIKHPVTASMGGLDLVNPWGKGVEKAGVVAYASRAFYATALAGGLIYTAGTGMISEKEGAWRDSAKQSIDYALTPVRLGTKYGIGYGTAGMLYTTERLTQGVVWAGSEVLSIPFGEKVVKDDFYFGLGEKLYKNRDFIAETSNKIKFGDSNGTPEAGTPAAAPTQQTPAPQPISNTFNGAWGGSVSATTQPQYAPVTSTYNASASAPSVNANTFNNTSTGVSTPLNVPITTNGSQAIENKTAPRPW